MFKINTNNSWLHLDLTFDKKVNLFIDDLILPDEKDAINIALLCEPQAMSNNKNFFIQNKEKYDIILTFDSHVLKSCENAEFFEFGSCWIDNNFDYNIKKKFEVSFLVGGKSYTDGHLLRQKVWNEQNRINTPKNFFNSSRNPYLTFFDSKKIGNKKDELFYSQYHICIENNRSEGYFSEKLIDCLFTKTIPIYWGCLDIQKWFNTKSIIIVNSLEEIIETCNNLSSEKYIQLKDSVEENYSSCLQFLDYKNRIEKKIIEIVERYSYILQ